MKKMILFSLLAFASAASAASINLEARVDNDGATYTNSTTPSYNKFYMQTGRMDWKGNVNEELSYRFRFRFDKDTGAVNKQDSLMQIATEFAALTHKFADNMSITLGKFNTDVGGVEQALTSGSDTYFKSQAFADVTSTSVTSTSSYLQYVTGARLTYSTNGQELSLIYGDQPVVASLNGTSLDQSQGLSGLVYKGSFDEKKILPIVSYYTINPANQTQTWALTQTPNNTYLDVGVKYDVPEYYVWLDYDAYTYKNKGASNQNDTTTSTVAEFGYKMDKWLPKLKAESSTTSTYVASGTNTSTTYTGAGLAVEYTPTKDNFRYHAAYTTRTTSVSGATGSNPVESHVVVGMKLVTDLLK